MNWTPDQVVESWKRNLPDDEWWFVTKWMNLGNHELERIDPNRLIYMEKRIEEYARTVTSQRRLRELRFISSRRCFVGTNFLFIFVLTLINSLIYAYPIHQLTSKLEFLYPFPLAISGSIILGLSVSLMAIRLFSSLTLRQYNRRIINKYSEYSIWQKSGKTEESENILRACFRKSGSELVSKMEGDSTTEKQTILAILLLFVLFIALENLTALQICFRVFPQAESRWYFPFLYSMLPLVLNWTIADTQSQIIELPRYCRRLISIYEELHSSQDRVEKGVEPNNYYWDARLDEELKVLFCPLSVSPLYPTLEHAGLAFDIDYFNDKIAEVERRKQVETINLERRYSNEINLLTGNIKGLLPEDIHNMALEIKKKQDDDLTQLEHQFDHEIDYLQKKINVIQQNYNKITERWERACYRMLKTDQDVISDILDAEMFDELVTQNGEKESRSFLPDRSAKIPHVRDLILYLRRKGWEQIDQPNPRLILFQGSCDDYGNPIQLVLPENDDFVDSASLISKVVNALAVIYDQTPTQVLEDINNHMEGQR